MERTTAATLTVYSETGDEQVIPLRPEGELIGRGPDCGVHLKSALVSRHHARIYQDPFGRWILEDLGSGNGTWVDGERIEASALLPGKEIKIGHFALLFSEESGRQIKADAHATSRSTVLEDDTEQIVFGAVDAEAALGRGGMMRFNEMTDRIAELSDPAELYPAVCRFAADEPGTMAAVLRLDTAPEAEAAELLACHFGGVNEKKDEPKLVAPNVHLSRRVLEAVRTTREAVKASDVGLSPGQMTLTIVDVRHPRTVCCAPIAAVGGFLDALYVSIPFDESDTDTMDFVRAAARQVGLARKGLLLAQERAERSALNEQLAWARNVQEKLTPKAVEGVAGVDIAARYRPAMWVGGDYCDMWRLSDGRVAFTVADVAGKGLPAAMVMSNLQATLRATMAFCSQPGRVMECINEHVNETMPDDTMITMFLGLFSPADGTLEYANAGHLPPVKVGGEDGATTLGEATGPPLGVAGASFESANSKLEPGAGVVIVTDGITEAMSPDDELFGLDRLRDVLSGAGTGTAEKMIQLVADSAERFRQHLPQQDDVTVLALLYRPAADAAQA